MATGKNDHPPSYDDSWCLCGNWVFSSALACLSGLLTGKYRKGNWTCGKCRHSNFVNNKKGDWNWCKKCGQSITE
eukprot:7126757-Heterocapsa_arctica.AAC.1